MKSYEGYLKQKFGDDYLLLAGGGKYTLSDFLTTSGGTLTGPLTFNINGDYLKTGAGYLFLEGFDNSKYIQLGYQTGVNGYDTYISGKNIIFLLGNGTLSNKFSINSSGEAAFTNNITINKSTAPVNIFLHKEGVRKGYIGYCENSYGNYIELWNEAIGRGIYIGDMNTSAPIFNDGSNLRVMLHSGNYSLYLGSGTSVNFSLVNSGTSPGRLVVSNAISETAYGFYINPTSTGGTYNRGVSLLAPTLSSGLKLLYSVGKSDSPRNQGLVLFCWNGDGSTSNFVEIGIHSLDEIAKFMADGTVIFKSSVYCNSDRRLKENISNINTEEFIKLLSCIKIRKFKWKSNNRYSYGFIAQELQDLIPECISIDHKGILSVDYNVAYAKIIASLIYKIKELEKEIVEIKNGKVSN